MRVAHFLPFPGIGGTELATLRLADALRPLGVESLAYCPDTAPALGAYCRDHGVATRTWHVRDPGAPRHMASYLWRTGQLGQQLRRHRVDVVHCADNWAVRPQVLAAARMAGAAVVCHVRNRNASLHPHRRRHFDAVDHFVFVSQATWRDFALPVAESRGSVLYDGVAVPPDLPPGERAAVRRDVRGELGLPEGTPLVGMVARTEPQKDFPTLARAARRVVDVLPAARVLVIGPTDLTPAQRAHFPEAQRAMEEQGVAEQVRFLGFRRDVPRLLRALDAAVLTTHWEGLPLAVWEAMAEGVPVVATAVDGIPEAIDDGVHGFLVAPGDDAAVADRLLRLLRDEALARRMGAAGRAQVQARFDAACFAPAMAHVYASVRRR